MYLTSQLRITSFAFHDPIELPKASSAVFPEGEKLPKGRVEAERDYFGLVTSEHMDDIKGEEI